MKVNKTIARLIEEYGEGSPRRFYRTIYKNVDCGPTIGLHINGEWICNSDLPDEISQGDFIDAVRVSSIVEGSDAEVEPITLSGRFSEAKFWEAVEYVNELAGELWEEANVGTF